MIFWGINWIDMDYELLFSWHNILFYSPTFAPTLLCCFLTPLTHPSCALFQEFVLEKLYIWYPNYEVIFSILSNFYFNSSGFCPCSFFFMIFTISFLIKVWCLVKVVSPIVTFSFVSIFYSTSFSTNCPSIVQTSSSSLQNFFLVHYISSVFNCVTFIS